VKKKKALVSSAFLVCLFAVLVMLQANMSLVAAQESPPIIDARDMTFLNQMQHRLAEYNRTGDWTKKIFPFDAAYLHSTESTVVIEVYVSDVEDTTRESIDISTNETAHRLRVYIPAEQVVAQLSANPHTHFYVSWIPPSISLTVEKQALQQIAEIPSVYCIRITPSMEFISLDNNPKSEDNLVLQTALPIIATCIALIAIGWAWKKTQMPKVTAD
jgi:hypothetical protein